MDEIVWKSDYGFILGSEELKNSINKNKYHIGVYIIWCEKDCKVIYMGSGPIGNLYNYKSEDFPQYESETLIINYAIIEDHDTILRVKKYLKDVYDPSEKVEGLFEGIEPKNIPLPTLPKLPVSTQE